jgi:hypothetical protein
MEAIPMLAKKVNDTKYEKKNCSLSRKNPTALAIKPSTPMPNIVRAAPKPSGR